LLTARVQNDPGAISLRADRKSGRAVQMSPLADATSLMTGFVVMLATPVYLLLQVWAPMKLHEGWRAAALAPLLPAVPLLVWCAYAFRDESNLWPVPMLLFAPFGAGYLGIVVAVGRNKAPA
jgi:hypothetical protein